MAAKKQTILDQMMANPRANWDIDDVRKACRQAGLILLPPSSGSHYKVCSARLRDILTIPAGRPIKPPYIRQLVSYSEAHRAEKGGSNE